MRIGIQLLKRLLFFFQFGRLDGCGVFFGRLTVADVADLSEFRFCAVAMSDSGSFSFLPFGKGVGFGVLALFHLKTAAQTWWAQRKWQQPHSCLAMSTVPSVFWMPLTSSWPVKRPTEDQYCHSQHAKGNFEIFFKAKKAYRADHQATKPHHNISKNPQLKPRPTSKKKPEPPGWTTIQKPKEHHQKTPNRLNQHKGTPKTAPKIRPSKTTWTISIEPPF